MSHQSSEQRLGSGPPNPRVQRTRSSPSALCPPLTRQPLERQKEMPPFARIPANVWQLRGGMTALANPEYARMMQRIAREAAVVGHRREKADSKRGYFRARVTLRCSSSAISLFHNSSAGYRAQYYSSMACGERANAFALRLLVPRVRELLNGSEKRTCPLW